MNGRTVADNKPTIEGEPGASDNRLTWSPGDYPETQEWQDGQQYTVTLTIRQTSPGEAEVLSLASKDNQQEEGAPVESEEAGVTEPTSSNDYPNPAVGRLMQGQKA